MKKLSAVLSVLTVSAVSIFLSGCSHQAVVPEAKNVKIARENPGSDCREIGPVKGSVKTSSGSIEQAIDDLKLDAARKGANYVRIEATGAMGTSASGTAYQCP